MKSSGSFVTSLDEIEIDVLVDLCGYAGTSQNLELVKSWKNKNPHKLLIAFMGFPGSLGVGNLWDYNVCDEVVVPRGLRKHYPEKLIMYGGGASYFVNSHNFFNLPSPSTEETSTPFTYCCHNRADKIDLKTLSTWFSALRRTTDSNTTLSLLSSGPAMQRNVLKCAMGEGVSLDRIKFVDILQVSEPRASLVTEECEAAKLRTKPQLN